MPPPRFDDFRGERWDRDRFERFPRPGGPGPATAERDYVRFEEREKFPGRRDVLLDEHHERRGPRGHYEERERYFEEDRYAAPPRRAATFLDEPIPAETSRQALAPYRRRPNFLRRQSSLDTFDRLPPRRDDYRLPADVPIPLPIRRPASPGRGRYYEEFEERYQDSDEDYRDIRVRKERRGDHRSKSRMRSRSVRRRKRSVSSSSSSSSSDESSHKAPNVIGKKGRTKMPKRLANKAAVIELGYPFEEEDNFIIVMRALEKDHIDEIITKSKKYSSDKTVTYKYEGTKDTPVVAKPAAPVVAAPPAVAVAAAPAKPAAPPAVAIAVAPPATAPPVVAAPPPIIKPVAPPAAPAGGEIVKTTKTTTTVVEPPHDHHHRQDLAVVVPHQRGRRATEADIRREIERLERERRLIRNDREYEEDWEIVDRKPRERDVYRVERDRKVYRSRSKPPPNPKFIGLAMSTLT